MEFKSVRGFFMFCAFMLTVMGCDVTAEKDGVLIGPQVIYSQSSLFQFSRPV